MSGVVIWFTGLPSSGKSTLAGLTRSRLGDLERGSCVLDGDVVRQLIAPKLRYSDGDRAEFYLALASLAAELARQGLIVLVAATAHLREYRRQARQLAPHFVEVWVTTPLSECRKRDNKGLYARGDADADATKLPGASTPYEEPEAAEVRASGGHDAAAVERIVSILRQNALQSAVT